MGALKGVSLAALVLCAGVLTACRREPAAPPAASGDEALPAPGATWDPWQEAQSRGIEFRAVGNEPGWFLEVDYQRWMRLLYAYGERQVTVPAVQPVVRGDVSTFDSSGGGHTVRADITAGPCSDGMSDQSYPLTVTVTVDGMPLRGCGRWLNR